MRRRMVGVLAVCLIFSGMRAAQHDPLFPIVENGKWGLIDGSGRVVLKPVFEALAPYQSELASLMSGAGAGSSARDFIALTDVWPRRGAVRTDRIGVRVNGKWGYADRNGNLVVEPRFDALDEYTGGVGREGLVPVLIGKHWGYADGNGRLVIPADLDTPFPFEAGRALVRRGDQWLVIDRTGAQVGALASGGDVLAYDWDSPGELVPIRIGERWGAINRGGALVVKPEFDLVRGPHEGLMSVRVGNKWGYIDLTGRLVIPPRFDSATPFSDGRAEVWVDKRFGVIDRTGAFVVAPQRFEIFHGFSGAAAWFKQGGKWGLLDREGRITVKPQFADIDIEFNGEGLSPATLDARKWGYVDATGQFVIPPRFQMARKFSDGLARVLSGKLWGYIDSHGTLVIPPQFDQADPFTDGLALVQRIDRTRLTREVSYVDVKGRVVYTMRFTGAG